MGDNNSPILLTNVPQPIATFNRPFALSELVGNLDGVMYLYNGSAVAVSCISYEETGQTKYALAYNNGQNRIAELTIEGNTLLCSTSNASNYLFDIDYKNQFRRSVPTGVTKMNVQIPQLLGTPSLGQGVAIVTDSESPDQLYVVADNANKRPYICQGDTVQNQQGVWANNMTFESVSALLQAIMTIEFTGYDEIPVNVQDTPYKESSASGYVVTPLIPQTLS